MLIYILLDAADQLFGQFQRLAVKHNEDNLHLMRQQKLADFGKGNVQCFILWKAIHSGGDQRKSYALAFQLCRQIQRFLVA